MVNYTPIKINVKDSRYLHIEWSDGKDSLLLLANLRKSCPCASCLAEKLNKPANYIPLLSTVQLQLKNIKPVGTYAIQLVWQDGHDTGIYTYEKLREGKY